MQRRTKGGLIIVSGPSGVGKGTICARLIEDDARIRMSVSATTRKPRPGEKDGVHYFFVSEEKFRSMIAGDELIEYMDVFGTNFYGTPAKYVDDMLARGMDVMLEIDVNGAMRVKSKRPDAVTVFIAPPSASTLRVRLEGRGTETKEQIEKRFSKAREEMARMGEYDYVIVNDSLEEAVADIKSIIRSGRLKAGRCLDLDEITKED